MAENIDEEHLDNSANHQAKNLSEDIISTEVIETIIPNQEIKNMEVHKHPHHVTHKKKWGEYFLEFLMIFLAVTLGFFAEAFREHINDRSKEKEYLSSMVEELKYDTAQYQMTLNKINFLRPFLDSCYMNVKEPERFNYVLLARWNTPINEMGLGYKPTLPTIEQLKSSGNLRLVENRLVINKIMEYETFVHGVYELHYENTNNATNKVYALEDELCDYTDFNAKLDENMKQVAGQLNPEGSELYDMRIVVKNPEKLNALANSFVNSKANNYGYATGLNNAIKIATELIKLLENKYNLK